VNKKYIKWSIILSVAAGIAAFVSCSTKVDTTSPLTYSVDSPSGIIGGVQSAITKSGSALGAVSAQSLNSNEVSTASFTSADCSLHGDPATIAQNNPRYPGALAYCKLTTNDGSPDTIPGGFAMPKSIVCALEATGQLIFDGTTRNVTITPSSACFTAQ